MQMRINDIQSRNLKTTTDPRDRGSWASIARPRAKLAFGIVSPCSLNGTASATLLTYFRMSTTRPSMSGVGAYDETLARSHFVPTVNGLSA
eukprot:630280-Pleurochrysis_carterae.AAC.1